MGPYARQDIEQELSNIGLLAQPKMFRDPVHDLIQVDRELFVRLLDTAIMQRLRRIRQLGTASNVFPGADHTRFAHSLGTFYLAGRLLDQLEITDLYDRVLIKCAALLHDIGHGPFSHLFESALTRYEYERQDDIGHAQWTQRMILEDDEISTALTVASNEQLGRDVADVIGGHYPDRGLTKIVDSQFDCDRLDYMLRDSLLTGVQYGSYDLSWLLRCLCLKSVSEVRDDQVVEDSEVVIDEHRGVSCLEHYLLGNLYLYKHVYWHKAVIAGDTMLESVIVRALELSSNNQLDYCGPGSETLEKIARHERLTVEQYAQLDDAIVTSWLKVWSEDTSTDPILQDLARRLLNRNLFKVVNLDTKESPDDLRRRAEQLARSQELDPRYYVVPVTHYRVAYKKIRPREIWIYDSQTDGDPVPLSEPRGEEYPISNAIVNFARHTGRALVTTKEIRDQITQ